MKKIIFTFFILFLAFSFNPQKALSQDTNHVLLEYCTGTWCPWCPCGHTIVQSILQSYPNTMVLGYHGGSDPWASYSAGIRGLMGFSAYPTGVVGRRTGIISRSAWYGQVASQTVTIIPSVRIELTKTYNASARKLVATANVIALQTIQGNYFLNFVLTESGMIYPQSGNGSCPGGSNYVHHHVVKGMLNGDLGEALNTGGTWSQGDTITKGLSYVIPSGFVAENCELNVFVYLSSGSLSSSGYVQQTKMTEVVTPTGIGNNGTIVSDYSLSQNYPNPFNPTTYIHFSIPKDGNTSLKFYDVLGNEVATYYNGFLKAGTYNAEFNGSTFSSGVYFYTLKAGDFVETKKMVLMK